MNITDEFDHANIAEEAANPLPNLDDEWPVADGPEPLAAA